jgi:dipeptidyl aminopeptidase/acylaminoacyl peptidase
VLWGWRIDAVVDAAGRAAGFDPEAASPLRAIQQTKAGVLLIHGTEDGYVPPIHSRRLHDAAPGHSELVVIEGKDHNNIMDVEEGPVVIREALKWFDSHLGVGR